MGKWMDGHSKLGSFVPGASCTCPNCIPFGRYHLDMPVPGYEKQTVVLFMQNLVWPSKSEFMFSCSYDWIFHFLCHIRHCARVSADGPPGYAPQLSYTTVTPLIMGKPNPKAAQVKHTGIYKVGAVKARAWM